MKRSIISLMLLLTFLSASAERPKVGLVLCGGGAKGAAHVGVLKVLEEYEIPIDMIVGTSMGAIIGGLYSIGYTASELDTLLMAQDWDLVMNDRLDRKKISYDRKKYENKYLVRIPFGLDDYSRLSFESRDRVPILSNVPMAVVNGHNIYNLFTKLSVGYQDSIDFNKMPIPFACVAVDLVNKEEVVFHSGKFVDAIRASMAIPGYFTPARIGDRVFVDGGALNNYPVDVAREMGADIIIGVKLGELEKAEKDPDVKNIGDMVGSLLDLYMGTKEAEAIANTDILITPSIKGYNALSFDLESLRALIGNGESAARSKRLQIEALKKSLDAAQREEEMTFVGPKLPPVTYKKAVHLDKDTITVGTVIVNGLNEDDARYLLKRSCFKPGTRLTGSQIEQEIERLYNTGTFESVTYLLKGREEPYDLELNFAGGRNSILGLGFRFDTEEIASVLLNVGLNNNSLYGSSLNVSSRLSYNMQTNVEYSYAFKSLARVNVGYDFRKSNLNLFDANARSNIFFSQNSVYAEIATKRFRNLRTSFGARMDIFDYKTVITSEAIPPIYDNDKSNRLFTGAYFNLEIDTSDNEFFPTYGYVMQGDVTYYFRDLFSISMDDYTSAKLHLSQVFPMGKRFAMIASLDTRMLFGGNVPMAYMNVMGGYLPGRYMDQQLPFIGFTESKVFENILASGTLDARMRIGTGHYIFASAAYALDCQGFSDFLSKPGIFGARLGYAYNSVIGPIAFNLNWSDATGKVGAFLSLGYLL